MSLKLNKRRSTASGVVQITLHLSEIKAKGEKANIAEIERWARDKGLFISRPALTEAIKLSGLEIDHRSKKMPPRSMQMDRTKAMAYCLSALYIHLGCRVPDLVEALAKGNQIDGMTTADAFPDGMAPAGVDELVLSTIKDRRFTSTNGEHKS